MRVALRTVIPGIATVMLLASACGPATERDVVPPLPPPTAGHLRMVEELRQVAEASRGENPYLGENKVRTMQAELAALPDQPDLRRWFFNLRLGRDVLRLGRTEEALEHYRTAYALLERWRDEIPPEYYVRTVFEFGSASMRQAETQNCVARHTSDSCLLPIRKGGVHADRRGAERASELLLETLAIAPEDSIYALRARWLLNIAAMVLDRWPEGVPQRWRLQPAALASDEPWPRLYDTAPALGLNPFDLAGSVIADDFDGDGLNDLLVSSSDTFRSLRLFRNRGDGGFDERVAEAGLEGIVGGLNMVQADYDNDGDIDVYVTRGAWWREEGMHPNSLLRNDGHGRFSDVTFEAGMGAARWPGQTAGWADYDGDGDLDLYVGNESDANVPAPGQLYRNEGDGTFSDVAQAAGVTNGRYAKAVAWGDYDDDGDPDLYVSNMGHDNRLYRNDGGGRFTDVAEQLGVEGPVSSFPCWFWDHDNDGRLDLFVAGYGGPNLAPDVADVAAEYFGLTSRSERDRLYRNTGDGFEDRAAAAGLLRTTLPMGANFGDLDNDGWLDIYLGTGYPHYEGLMPNLMLLNRGGARFVDVTSDAGLGHLQKGHGIAFVDLDHDGDQDLYAQMGGMYPGDAFGNALFENPGTGGAPAHWIKLSLRGRTANRSGIGARVRIELADGSTIHRVVGSGGSFGGNPLRMEIGLGAATGIERLELRWPGSGTVQSFRDLDVDRWYVIDELVDTPETRPLAALTLGGNEARNPVNQR